LRINKKSAMTETAISDNVSHWRNSRATVDKIR
jgi:hypothetical protein